MDARQGLLCVRRGQPRTRDLVQSSCLHLAGQRQSWRLARGNRSPQWAARLRVCLRLEAMVGGPFRPPQASCLFPASSGQRREGVGSPKSTPQPGARGRRSPASPIPPGSRARPPLWAGALCPARAPSAPCRPQFHLGCASAAAGGSPPGFLRCLPEPFLGKWLLRKGSLGKPTPLEWDPAGTGSCFRILKPALSPVGNSLFVKSHGRLSQTARHRPRTFWFLKPEVTWYWGFQPPATFLPGGPF